MIKTTDASVEMGRLPSKLLLLWRFTIAGFILALSISSFAQIIGTNQTIATNASPTGPLPPPPPPLVLTNPPIGNVPQFPSFSAQPSTAEIKAARVFDEPLIPCDGSPSQDENAAFANSLKAFASRTNADDFSALQNYLDNDVDGHWYSSLLFNLGWEYYNTGYYSKALDAWEEDWFWLQDETSGASKTLADRCLGELAKMHARIGDYQRLQELFGQIGNRPITGPGTSLVAGSRQALWLMKNRPEIAFRCGPLALRNICKLLNPSVDVDEIIEDSASTTNGFSLSQLYQLSKQLQLNFQIAKRQPGSPMLLPCVVHWNVGHYAAILAQAGNRYFVADPTFGISRWISGSALNEETSGYFLVPPGTLTNGWQSVGDTEAAAVWGKGVTGNSSPNDTTEYDEMADPDCGSVGMATYNMHLMLVSLHLEDTPISFTPPRGPKINFTITYNQLEANQPANFNYSNLGQKWTCNWISYLTDDGTNPPGDVQYYVPGGGTETFSYQTNGTYSINWRDQARLASLSSTSYSLAFPDGSIQIFSQPNGTAGNSRKVFLTQIIDPTGYTNLLNYDSNLRLVTVTDPQASATNLTFYYSSGVPYNIYTIQQVTDRYGRAATFGYNGVNDLTNSTDALGLSSYFFYDNAYAVTGLKTPYGMTTFSYGDNGDMRWLEATDPQGATSRAEFNQSPDTGISNSDPGPIVPKPLFTRNYILYGRNTFYWDKKAMAEAPGNYAKARLYHWLHNADLASAVGCLESVKEPLENRVWFNYPGQAAGSAGATIFGSQNLPSAAGRVMDDGTTQLYQYSRNSLGNITNSIDPVGLSFSYDYATNQVDLLRVRQTTGTNNELNASFTYNSQHLPLTAVDASGQTNHFAYNAYGQITGVTNALSQTTTFSYDTNGRLLTITGPTNADIFTFTYDAYDRVKTATDPDGYTVTTTYDAFDRPTTNTYPDGSKDILTYKYLDPQTHVDRAGRLTQFTYDSLRHLTQITEATNWNTYLGWCACGNLASITDPLGRMTQWSYDLQGRVTSKQSADGSTVKYSYENTTSRVKTFTNERNQTRTNSYYANDHLKEVVYANSAVTAPVAFNYDSYGRITAMFDGYGSLFHTNTVFTYYPVTSPPALGAGRLKTVVDANGCDTLGYVYDALGRLISESMTNTGFTSYFSSIGFVGYGSTYTYDVLGRLTQQATPQGYNFTYNYVGASSRLASIINSSPYGMATTFGYYNTNGDMRLLGLTNSAKGSAISRFNYAYNEEGQITNLVEQLASGLLRTNRISYDAIGEVLSVLTNGTSGYYYAYDLAGNRTLEQQGASAWHARFNPLNEIQSKDVGLSATNIAYQFDEENRLVSISTGSFSNRMVYNGFGRLAYRTEYNNGLPSMYHWYVWDGEKIAEESYQNTNSSNNTYYHWYYDNGFFDVNLWQAKFNPFIWTTHDALGSEREYYTDNYNGQIFLQYDYDPYGRQSVSINGFDYFGNTIYYPSPPEFGFTGLMGMSGLNLLFAENRVYDPDLGRWLSRDPIGESGGLNLYRYAGNDPIDNIDPSGLCPVPGDGSAGGRPPKTPIVTSSAGADFEGENPPPNLTANTGPLVESLPNGTLRIQLPKPPLDDFPYQQSPTSRVLGPGVEPGTYVYVRDASGVVHIAENGPHMHPQVLGQAKPAIGAGEVTIGQNGVVTEINNESGTFRFAGGSLWGVQQAMENQGMVIQAGAVKSTTRF